MQQLSSGTPANPYEIDTSYLKIRSSSLTSTEKIVNVMFDEVYTCSRVECVGGKLVGLTEEGKMSKTVFVFMIQSLHSKYKDVVKIIPLDALNTKLLENHFRSVLTALAPLYTVVSVASDNHVVNR